MSMEHWWIYSDRENPQVFGGKTEVVPLCPPQIVTRADLGWNMGSRVERPATNLLSHAAAWSVPAISSSQFWISIKHIKSSSCF